MAARIIVLALVALAATAVQSAVVPHLALLGVRPDLPLILTACIGLVAGPIPAMGVGFAGGLLTGALDGGSPGLAAAFLTLVGYLAGALRGRLFVEHWAIAAAVVGLLSLGAQGGRALVSWPQGWPWWQLAAGMAGGALYNAALAYPAYALLRRARGLLPGAAART